MSLVAQVWDAYQTFQQSNPLLGSMLTAEATFTLGDIVSQLIVDKKVDWKKVSYTAKLAPIYGAGVYGLMESGDLVGKLISEHPLVKAALGPNLFGNVLNSYFFANNTIGERNGYKIRELVNNYASIFSQKDNKTFFQNFKEKYIKNIPGKEFLKSVIVTLTVWNGIQYLNYSYVSDEMRTPVALACGVAWLSVLSLWSLKGRRKIVYDKPDKYQSSL
ncbi:MAG: Mpv17/PMP22 family protein [Nanoarchaeota archaeon]|nr:Mpv17/PMP22 family protein [Nanoarchaeota archaeon]MBU1321158.1 Mpv17/PMP22 family protein [Nanoarchaeota archaeon]MBU1596958.1 Mpv17/PMP22 family protein [Nanoarchaeota archaeon]MBU2441524.1 Mpv17/PMP22 family protein [Nanoarchaeota archaeon]